MMHAILWGALGFIVGSLFAVQYLLGGLDEVILYFEQKRRRTLELIDRYRIDP